MQEVLAAVAGAITMLAGAVAYNLKRNGKNGLEQRLDRMEALLSDIRDGINRLVFIQETHEELSRSRHEELLRQ